MKKIIGYLILLVLSIALFCFVVYLAGIKGAIGIYLFSFLVFGLVYLAIHLITE